MGDGQNGDLRVDFDRRLKLKFLGSQVTTDAGLLAYRELDETFGLTEVADGLLTDSRIGKNKQHGLAALLRQSIYSRLAGYEDVNDAERLAVDPAMRHVVGAYQRVLVEGAAPDWFTLIPLSILTLVVVGGSWLVFRHLSPDLVDEL